jgi:hypothetical protein
MVKAEKREYGGKESVAEKIRDTAEKQYGGKIHSTWKVGESTISFAQYVISVACRPTQCSIINSDE